MPSFNAILKTLVDSLTLNVKIGKMGGGGINRRTRSVSKSKRKFNRACRIEELEGREMLSVSPWAIAHDHDGLQSDQVQTQESLTLLSATGDATLTGTITAGAAAQTITAAFEGGASTTDDWFVWTSTDSTTWSKLGTAVTVTATDMTASFAVDATSLTASTKVMVAMEDALDNTAPSATAKSNELSVQAAAPSNPYTTTSDLSKVTANKAAASPGYITITLASKTAPPPTATAGYIIKGGVDDVPVAFDTANFKQSGNTYVCNVEVAVKGVGNQTYTVHHAFGDGAALKKNTVKAAAAKTYTDVKGLKQVKGVKNSEVTLSTVTLQFNAFSLATETNKVALTITTGKGATLKTWNLVFEKDNTAVNGWAVVNDGGLTINEADLFKFHNIGDKDPGNAGKVLKAPLYTLNIGGLAASTKYTVEFRSSSTTGQSAKLVKTSASTLKYDAVKKQAAKVDGENVSLTWTAHPNGATTGYEVWMQTKVGKVTTDVLVDTIYGSSISSVNVAVSTLKANAMSGFIKENKDWKPTLQVRAIGEGPDGTIVQSLFAKKAVAVKKTVVPAALDAPTEFTATAMGPGITLTWDGVAGATGYEIRYREAGAALSVATWATPKVIADGAVHSYDLTGFEAGKTYLFEIAAVKDAATSAWVGVYTKGKPAEFSAISSFTVAAVLNNSFPNTANGGTCALTLDWDAIDVEGVEYRVYWTRADVAPEYGFDESGELLSTGSGDSGLWMRAGGSSTNYPFLTDGYGKFEVPGCRVEQVSVTGTGGASGGQFYFFVVADIPGRDSIVSDVVGFNVNDHLANEMKNYAPAVTMEAEKGSGSGSDWTSLPVTWDVPQLAVSGNGNDVLTVNYKVYYSTDAAKPAAVDAAAWVLNAEGALAQRANGTTHLTVTATLTNVPVGAWVMIEVTANGYTDYRLVLDDAVPALLPSTPAMVVNVAGKSADQAGKCSMELTGYLPASVTPASAAYEVYYFAGSGTPSWGTPLSTTADAAGVSLGEPSLSDEGKITLTVLGLQTDTDYQFRVVVSEGTFDADVTTEAAKFVPMSLQTNGADVDKIGNLAVIEVFNWTGSNGFPDNGGNSALTLDSDVITTSEGNPLLQANYTVYWTRVDEGNPAPAIEFNADGSLKLGDGGLGGWDIVPFGDANATNGYCPIMRQGPFAPGENNRMERIRPDQLGTPSTFGTDPTLYFIVVARVDGYATIMSDAVGFDLAKKDEMKNSDGTPYAPVLTFATESETATAAAKSWLNLEVNWDLPQLAVNSVSPGNRSETHRINYTVYYSTESAKPDTSSASWTAIGTQTFDQRADGGNNAAISTMLVNVHEGAWIMIEITSNGYVDFREVAGQVPPVPEGTPSMGVSVTNKSMDASTKYKTELAWNEPEDMPGTITYSVFYHQGSTAIGSDDPGWVLLTEDSATGIWMSGDVGTRNVTVLGLDIGSSYQFKVEATNGSETSTVATAVQNFEPKLLQSNGVDVEAIEMFNAKSVYITTGAVFPDPSPANGFVALTFDWSPITAEGRDLVASEYEIYWCRVDITDGVPAAPPAVFNPDGSVNTTATQDENVHAALEGKQWVPIGTQAAAYPGTSQNNLVNVSGGSKLPGYTMRSQRIRHDGFPDQNPNSMLYFFVVARVDGYQTVVSDIFAFDYSQRLNRVLTNPDGTPYKPEPEFANVGGTFQMTWTLPQVASSNDPSNTYPVQYKVYYSAESSEPSTDSGSWVEVTEAAGELIQQADGSNNDPLTSVLTDASSGSWIMVEVIAYGCAETKVVVGQVP